jgi:hypothetical protein
VRQVRDIHINAKVGHAVAIDVSLDSMVDVAQLTRNVAERGTADKAKVWLPAAFPMSVSSCAPLQ